MKIFKPFLIKRNYRLFTIGWAIAIFIISTIPNLPQPAPIDEPGFTLRFDYLFHFLVYFILGLLMVVWQTNEKMKIGEKRYYFLLLFGILFAFVDEWHQLLIPGRRFNPIDFYLNAIGLLAGFLFTYHYLLRHVMRKKGKLHAIRDRLFN